MSVIHDLEKLQFQAVQELQQCISAAQTALNNIAHMPDSWLLPTFHDSILQRNGIVTFAWPKIRVSTDREYFIAPRLICVVCAVITSEQALRCILQHSSFSSWSVEQFLSHLNAAENAYALKSVYRPFPAFLIDFFNQI